MGVLGEPGEMFDRKPHPLITNLCSAVPLHACVRARVYDAPVARAPPAHIACACMLPVLLNWTTESYAHVAMTKITR